MGWPVAKFRIIRVVCVGRGNQKDAALADSFDESIQVRNDLLGARDVELAAGSMKSACASTSQKTVLGEIKTTPTSLGARRLEKGLP